jgi:hypothetical protein
MKAYWRNPRPIADAIRDDDLEPAEREVWNLVHPDAVWNTGDERIGTYRGHLEIASAWDDFFEIADDYAVSVREIMDCGDDRVFAGMDRIATAKLSGIRATFPVFAVMTIKQGLIAQVDEYMSRNEALEAAGLRE